MAAPLAVPTFQTFQTSATDAPLYSNRESPIKDEDDWESMMEICHTDEAEKIRQLIGDKPQALVTDPKQCLICRRTLSCKSALQMHYRTHTGERPYRCKICLTAFKRKWNLKTHMSVHRSKHPFRKRFHTNQLRSSSNQNLSPPAAPPKQPKTSRGIQEMKVSTAGPIISAPLTVSGSLPLETGKRIGMAYPPHYPFSMLPASLSLLNPQHLNTMSGLPFAQTDMAFLKSTNAHDTRQWYHTKERPFRGFSTKGNMNQHLLTHKIREMPRSNSERESHTTHSIPESSCVSGNSSLAEQLDTHFFGASSFGVEHSYPSCSGASGSVPVVERTRDSMMWMWRNVCSVCQRVCSCPTELQEHLKQHLSRFRTGAPV